MNSILEADVMTLPAQIEPQPVPMKAYRLLSDALSEYERELVWKYIESKQVPAGELLWMEGEPGDYLALIVSGEVETLKDTEFRGKQVVIGLHQQGTVIGIESVMDGGPRPVTAKAMKETELVILSKENFEMLSMESPEFANKMLRKFLQLESTRLRKSLERLTSFF